MNVIELVEELIKRGQESLRKCGSEEHLVEGGLQGFELCRTIEPTLEAYDAIIAMRERHLARKRQANMDKVLANLSQEEKGDSVKDYWRYLYATAQIEYVYQVLRVAYKQPTVSARAVQVYADIVGVKP